MLAALIPIVHCRLVIQFIVFQVILRDKSSPPNQNINIKFDDHSEVKCNYSVKTPELEKFLEVPWEVPKLRKKIAQRKKNKTLVNIQGSDSGISMSSQDTKDVQITKPWTMLDQEENVSPTETKIFDSTDQKDCDITETIETNTFFCKPKKSTKLDLNIPINCSNKMETLQNFYDSSNEGCIS